MCGIIGYIGPQKVTSTIIDGLKRLEYRGYDSAGICVLNSRGIDCVKTMGKVEALEEILKDKKIEGTVGLGHTRWATHGVPSEVNAHPHFDCTKKVYLVHNGIIENYKELKKELVAKRHKFVSETDTEVLVHLIEQYYYEGELQNVIPLEEAVKKTLRRVRGTYGLVAISQEEPKKMIAARNGSPLLVGLGDNEYIIASDASAIIRHTKQVVYLNDEEMVVLTPEQLKIVNLKNQQIVKREKEEIDWDISQAEKNGFPHFMLKEIFEGPEVIENALRGRLIAKEGLAKLGGLELVREKMRDIKRFIIIACGTAHYAGRVGEYMFEEYANIPTEVEYASEFRYRRPVIDQDTAVLVISQSGETADTLAALREAKRKGAITLGIVNVVGSTIARETEAGVYNHAGPEIGVASTKAFLSQLTILALLTLFLARQREMSITIGQRIAKELQTLPESIKKILEQNKKIKKIALKYKDCPNFLYLGRKYNFPIALEGALKLKEISYLHAEGYSAGEMKHGPIALIDKKFPSVFIVPKDSVYEKNISNIEEIKARRGKIIAIASEGDEDIKQLVDEVIYIPKTIEMLTPILSVVPCQLLAYYMAVALGCDVDKPRNLAKSVTVE